MARFLGLILALFSASCFSAQVTQYKVNGVYVVPEPGGWSSSVAGSCAATATYYAEQLSSCETSLESGVWWYRYAYKNGAFTGWARSYSTKTVEESSPCKEGISGGSSGSWAGAYCQGGCAVAATVVVTPKGSRSVWMTTGAACSDSPDTPSAPPEAPTPPSSSPSAPAGTGPCPGGADVCPPSKGSCPKGTFATEVAGQALCVSTQPLKDEPAKTGQTNGPAASTGTSTKTTNTKTTTNPDGSTTTTETSSESKSGTEEKPNDMSGFCKENPEAAVCGDGGSWSGGCGSFTCGGDPVQCAQARAAAEIQCKLEIGHDDPNVSAGQSAVNGGATPNGHPRNDGDTVNFSLGTMIDATPLFGSSGECIADKTVPMLGKTLTIPFSRMCTALELLGYAFLACCYLSAAYIVFGRA